jgi:hypothetical protein
MTLNDLMKVSDTPIFVLKKDDLVFRGISAGVKYRKYLNLIVVNIEVRNNALWISVI